MTTRRTRARAPAETIEAFASLPGQRSLFPAEAAVIRRHSADDLKVSDLHQLAEADALAHLGTGEKAWGQQDYDDALDSVYAHVAIARVGGRIVGALLWEEKMHSVNVSRLYVAEGYRRQGLGLRLVQLLVDQLAARVHEHKRYLRVFVNEYRTEAACFFRAAGFKCIDTIPDRFGTEKAAYFFVRDLRCSPTSKSGG